MATPQTPTPNSIHQDASSSDSPSSVPRDASDTSSSSQDTPNGVHPEPPPVPLVEPYVPVQVSVPLPSECSYISGLIPPSGDTEMTVETNAPGIGGDVPDFAPSYVLQDHDELVARVEENNWDAEIAEGLNDDTDSVSLTQGVKREFVAGRCPAIYGSGDYKGSQCKFSTRQFTVYCGSHNKCVQCNKKCTDDWPKCVACEPDAPRPPPKKKRAKPKEDLQ